MAGLKAVNPTMKEYDTMLKNMKIRSRMLVSYAIILAFTIIACVAGVVMISNVGGSLTGFYNQQFQTVNQAWTARRAVYAARNAMLQAIIEPDISKTEAFLKTASDEGAAMAKAIQSVGTTFAGDASLVTQIEELLTKAGPIRERIAESITSGKADAAYKTLNDEYIPLTDEIRSVMTEISNQADANAKSRVVDGQSLTSFAIILVSGIAVLSVAVGLFFAFFISNSIRKPVAEIEAAAKSLSHGELSAKIDYTGGDELGSLADSMRTTIAELSGIVADMSYLMGEIAGGNFNNHTRTEESYVGDFRPILINIRDMNQKLSDTMRQINESADQVSSGSEQVSGGAQALSQGATEQASSVEELAATITEISEQISSSAASAAQASLKAEAVRNEMEDGNKRMQEMMEAMTEISQSSGEIGKIIKTIEDIAFQTNILALNAAVEAARAGTAGKGFAVVADEVRNLASKSAEASKNTAGLIASSIESVENGRKIAEKTAQVMVTAVEGVREVTDAVDSISAASAQQADAATQVTTGIDQISSVVQTNSATAEESAAASEELSAQALNLNTLVSRFKLRD